MADPPLTGAAQHHPDATSPARGGSQAGRAGRRPGPCPPAAAGAPSPPRVAPAGHRGKSRSARKARWHLGRRRGRGGGGGGRGGGGGWGGRRGEGLVGGGGGE